MAVTTESALVREALFALDGFPGNVFVIARPSRFALRIGNELLPRLGVLMSLARTASIAAKLRWYASSGRARPGDHARAHAPPPHTLHAFKAAIRLRLMAFTGFVAHLQSVAHNDAAGEYTTCGGRGTTGDSGRRPVATLLWVEMAMAAANRELGSLWRCCRAVGTGLRNSSAVAAAVLSTTFGFLEASFTAEPSPGIRRASAFADATNGARTHSCCGAPPWRTIFAACCRPYFRIMGQWCGTLPALMHHPVCAIGVCRLIII